MIALHDNLPLVEFANGAVMHFQTAWLHRSLSSSARRAGYDKWWLAEHVATSVVNYLTREYDSPTVSSQELDLAVRSVLRSIGFADIAETFHSCPPPARLSLVKVAHEAGSGYELFFFGLLRDQLRGILQSPTEDVQICDLQSCVKTLHCARHWKLSCSRLRDEIVEFIRVEIDSANRSENLTLQLS